MERLALRVQAVSYDDEPSSDQSLSALAVTTDGHAIPLGSVRTTPSGYASFDIEVLRGRPLRHLWLGDATNLQSFDALSSWQLGAIGVSHEEDLEARPVYSDKVARDSTFVERPLRDPTEDRFAPEGIVIHGPLFVRAQLPSSPKPVDAALAELRVAQAVDVTDWRYGADATIPDSPNGEGTQCGDCRALLPSNVSVQEFRFSQLVPLSLGPHGYHHGFLDEWTVSFYPIGHALGQVVYSLALAPCESVKLAVIDWSREDGTSRDEDTTARENLVHNLKRDRTIEEVVHATLDEWQRGGSVMGGVAASGTTGALGAAAALGGGYATTSGTRDLNADMSQRVADAVGQASTSVRSFTSTVVVQQSEAEKSTAQTRVVRNHNHCHALTVLYHEVVRHYRVVTRPSRRRRVLLAPFASEPFKGEDLLGLESVLRSVVPSALIGGFAAARKQRLNSYSFDALTTPTPADDYILDHCKFTVKCSHDTWCAPAVITKDGQRFPLERFLPVPSDNDPLFSSLSANKEILFSARPSAGVRTRWGNVAQIQVDTGHTEHFLRLRVTQPFGLFHWELVDHDAQHDAPPKYEVPSAGQGPFRRWSFPVKDPVGSRSVELTLTREERMAQDELLDHLNANRVAYRRYVALAEDPGERAVRFMGLLHGSKSLLLAIENEPVAVLGNLLAFPTSDVFQLPPDKRQSVERLASLPTRGVFAEARLSTCSVCEEKDNTRFWDWQESPCMDEAPEIQPVNTDTRHQAPTGVQPTPLPNPVVSIVSPPAAPDPTGLTSALQLMATANIFRDMSMKEQVADLLKKLSDNATLLAAKKIDEDHKGTATGGGATKSAPTATNSVTPALAKPKPTTSEQHDQMQVLRNAADHGELTAAQKNARVASYLEDATAPATAVDATVPRAPGAEVTLVIAVQNDAGTPVPGVTVMLTTVSSAPPEVVDSDANGNAQFSARDGYDYLVEAQGCKIGTMTYKIPVGAPSPVHVRLVVAPRYLDDVMIDPNMALIFSEKAPLVAAAGTKDARAVWTVKRSQTDATVLVFLHGNDGFVTLDKQGDSLVPDWANAKGKANIAARLDLQSGITQRFEQLSVVDRYPLVVLPEDCAAVPHAPHAHPAKFWSVPPAGQYTNTAQLGELIGDVVNHLKCVRHSYGAPYLDSSAVSALTSLRRVYLSGHSGGGKPLHEAAASEVLEPKLASRGADLWLLDCTYGYGIANYVAFGKAWKGRAGNGSNGGRLVCIYREKEPKRDENNQAIAGEYTGTEMEADALRSKLNAEGCTTKFYLHSSTTAANDASLRAALQDPTTGAIFIKTMVAHSYIPREFVPVLLETSAGGRVSGPPTP